MDTESIRNWQEQAVYECVLRLAPLFSCVGDNEELMADVACLALNSLKPRYIRHEIDMHFYLSNAERTANDAAVQAAVQAAFRRLDVASGNLREQA